MDLAAKSEFLIYFQSPDAAELLAVRKAALARGLLGTRVFADQGSWRHVHLADNLAGLVWLSPAAREQTPPEEALRVLHPEGKALYGRKEVVKPLPAGADAWSYPYHGPDNNPQSRDQVARTPGLTQFLAEPMFSPMPEITVAAAGRVFKAFGLRATHANQNAVLNTLMGINGYNGAILWRRPLRAGFMLDRNTMIATADILYLADDESCKRIDARTGEIARRDRRSRGPGRRQSLEMDGLGHGPARPNDALRPGGRRRGQAEDRGLRQRIGGGLDVSRRGRLGLQNEKTNFGFGRTVVAINPAHQANPLET